MLDEDSWFTNEIGTDVNLQVKLVQIRTKHQLALWSIFSRIKLIALHKFYD